MAHILVVEDEIKLAKIVEDYLKQAEFKVSLLHRGDTVEDWLRDADADLVILDIMLPGKDGMEICKDIRKHSLIPIIMTTAKVEEIDRLLGLELGADDYLCKPYSPRELVARVKAVLRRVTTEKLPNSEQKLSLVSNTNYAEMNGQRVELTVVEYRLLETLLKSPGRIFNRDQLISAIYDDRRVVSDRTIDSHIKKLRKKLQQLDPDQDFVRSIYGAGYKVEQ